MGVSGRAGRARNGDNEGVLCPLAARCLLAALLLSGPACGIKAPPVPRETVVPSPVLDLSVQADVGGGVVLEFTLPATRLDGGPLGKIAGYRVVRRGPDGALTEHEVRFGFSQRSAMVGKRVSLPDGLPPGPGVYRYTVVPLDAYGSHPRGNVWAEFSRDGGPGRPDPLPPESGGAPEALPEPSAPGGGIP